jgi:hypothetical protein
MKTTRHFERYVRLAHEEANRTDWIEQVLAQPDEVDIQSDGRIRHWGYIQEAGRYIRVVTLSDGETVQTAFFDRNYSLRRRREGR